MKTKTIFSSLLVVGFLILSEGIQAINDTYSATLNVSAGNLSTMLGNKKDSITNLNLTGTINGSDVSTLRNMGMLSKLNMEDIQIVSGGSFSVDGTDISVHENEIPSKMFSNLRKLTYVTMPKNITSIGDYAFNCCTGLLTITIPDNVVSLGIGAFHDCNGCTSVYIGKSVASIGLVAFSGDYNLKEFVVSPNNVSFCTLNGTLFNIGKDKLIHYPNARSSVYTIPTSVTMLEAYSFCSCYALTEVTIPSGVSSISNGSFYNCTALSDIYCKMSVPPTVAANSFYNVNTAICKLHVPYGTAVSYKSAVVWGDFANIVEEMPTGISDSETKEVAVYSLDGAIVVENAQAGSSVSVYNALGALVEKAQMTDNVLRIPVPGQQLYIIRIEGKSYKILQ